jgi:L-ascorbate metabolism protein UlaG (beta-lactamase superfamily)
MIISYHGGEFIKIVFGDTTLAFNAPSKDSKLKSSRFGADIAFTSLNHVDMNGGEELSRGEKNPFVVMGPGEYEVGGVFSIGIPTRSTYGGSEKINTLYSVQFEGMNIIYAGALCDPDFNKDALDDIESVDILFLPIGGEGVFNPSEAMKFANSLEAKIIIPIHYAGIGEKDALKTFLKEASSEGTKAIDKYTIKKKDISESNGVVVVLDVA